MNAIDENVVEIMNDALDIAEKDFKGLVIGHDGDTYSAGANLLEVLTAIGQGKWDQLEALVKGFQDANQRTYYSPIPVVTAPHGVAPGGGAGLAVAGSATGAAAALL